MKKNVNVLLAVFGGISLCLLCVGIVKLFPQNAQNNLKGNEQVPLADVSCTYTTTQVNGYETDYTPSTNCAAQQFSGTCYERGTILNTDECGSDDEYDCYSWTQYTITCTDEPTTCGPGHYVSGDQCPSCPPGTAKNVTSTATSCSPCTGDEYSSNSGALYCVPKPQNSQVNSDHTGWTCNAGYHANGMACEENFTPQITASNISTVGGTVTSISPSATYNSTTVSGTFSCNTTSTSLVHIDFGDCTDIQTTSVTSDTSVTIRITFTPTDTGTYKTATKDVTLTIQKSCLAEGKYRNGTNCYDCAAGTELKSTTEECSGSSDACCQAATTYACYGSGSVQGLSGVTWTTAADAASHNMVLLANTPESTCRALAAGEWCFKDGEGVYHWGLMYSNGSYTHQPGVSSQGDCGKNTDGGLKCFCNAAGGCSMQTASNTGFPNYEPDASKCSIASVTGNNIIAISGDETVTGTYTAYNSNGKSTNALTWSKSDFSKMVLGSDCTGGNSSVCHVTYSNLNPCSNKTVKVTAASGSSSASLNVTVYFFNAWSGPTKYEAKDDADHNSKLHQTRTNEKFMNDCDAYENWTQDATTGKWTADRYYRCCGSSGGNTSTKYSYCCAKDDGTNYTYKTNQTSETCPSGYTIDRTKDSNTCKNSTVYKCFQDGDGAYHWTNSPENNWVEVNKSESECKNEPACFEEPNGTRVWGIHFDKISQGYKLITSIKDETLCLNPSTTDACYVNNDDDTDYKWSSTAPEGYTAVTGVTKAEDCQPALCYWKESTQTFEFGKYANTSGYFKVYDADDRPIADINKCAAPDGEACYKNPNGDYEWGDFSKDSDYTLVPSITTITKCTNEEVVPSTGVDVSKLVYVFMAVLMAVGIGFIYYSTIMKKEN